MARPKKLLSAVVKSLQLVVMMVLVLVAASRELLKKLKSVGESSSPLAERIVPASVAERILQ